MTPNKDEINENRRRINKATGTGILAALTGGVFGLLELTDGDGKDIDLDNKQSAHQNQKTETSDYSIETYLDWDYTSRSRWNSFTDERVPGTVDEIYTESTSGSQYIIVENQNSQAYQVSYDELDLNSKEEKGLENSDNYLEFFEIE